MKKAVTKAIAYIPFAAMALVFSAPPAFAVAPEPTRFAMESCSNGQWEAGYDSYEDCAREAWNMYCYNVDKSGDVGSNDPLGIASACKAGNPWGMG